MCSCDVADEMLELFSKREVTAVATNKPKKTSMLSEMLRVSSDQPVNPFREYSKFDGEVNTYYLLKKCEVLTG